jgi:hypothetical protein
MVKRWAYTGCRENHGFEARENGFFVAGYDYDAIADLCAEAVNQYDKLRDDIQDRERSLSETQDRLASTKALLDEAAHVIIDHQFQEVGRRWAAQWERRYRELKTSDTPPASPPTSGTQESS